MIVLDTDHLSILANPLWKGFSPLAARMRSSPDQDFATSIVTVEEQLGGWLAAINKNPDVGKQIVAYDRLQQYLEFFTEWSILPVNQKVADEFARLKKLKVRIGSRDLKIASIALVNDALLLSANLRDFRRVPGLRVESWIG